MEAGMLKTAKDHQIPSSTTGAALAGWGRGLALLDRCLEPRAHEKSSCVSSLSLHLPFSVDFVSEKTQSSHVLGDTCFLKKSLSMSF